LAANFHWVSLLPFGSRWLREHATDHAEGAEPIRHHLHVVFRRVSEGRSEPGLLSASDHAPAWASIEARFGAGTTHVPHPIEWLSDSGPPYTAHETQEFGRDSCLLVCTTPSYSPESNGMAEAFVKTFKRDYVYLAELHTADSVLRAIGAWFADYNDHHPHSGLGMRSPRQFRAHAA
jgi:transposase InsO family protein